MKIDSVLVVSDPDQELSYVQLADRVVRIGVPEVTCRQMRSYRLQ